MTTGQAHVAGAEPAGLPGLEVGTVGSSADHTPQDSPAATATSSGSKLPRPLARRGSPYTSDWLPKPPTEPAGRQSPLQSASRNTPSPSPSADGVEWSRKLSPGSCWTEQSAPNSPSPPLGLDWDRLETVEDLKGAFASLHDEVQALRTLLISAGVLKKEAFQARLHRQRFEKAQRAHPTACEATLQDALGAKDLGYSTALLAGLDAATALKATSTAMRRSVGAFHGNLRQALSRLVVCGGWDVEEALDTVERFEPISARWEALPPLCEKRAGAVCSTVGHRIYVCGGWDGSTPKKSVEVYDAAEGAWKLAQPMRCERFSARGGTLEGSVIICGGWDGQQALRSAERFDVKAERWEEIPSMLNGRAHAAAAVVGGQYYCCGGWDGTSSLSHAERFNQELGAWEELPPLSQQVARGTAAGVKGKFFVCGGWAGMQALQTMECFDPQVGAWEQLQPMLQRRAGAAAASVAGCMYVCGGWDGQKALSSVERYDPATGRWEALKSLSQPLRGAAATASLTY